MFASILRTIVPALWGSFIGWVLAVVPILEPLREDLLAYADVLPPIISAVIIAAWYAFWRWLEPRLPDWLTRIVLGSAETPAYEGKHVATENERQWVAGLDVVTGRFQPQRSDDLSPAAVELVGKSNQLDLRRDR